ncbi:MAG: DUF302 domain-containing protein [Dehalococcoidia bacterium]|nr:DUF302 domain-containing protein [Dehalococcoidia bacterium]
MEEAEARMREALKARGFGVLTEVDVQEVLKDRIGVDVEPYRILGVCNPQLAHAAISLWKGFGLIAPCNVAIYDVGEHRVVIAFDPEDVPEVRDNVDLYRIAQQASLGIREATATLEGT